MHSHLAKMVGQYILEQREKKDILQKELAEELGISAQFLGRIEKGDVKMPEPTLVACISKLSLSQSKLNSIYRAASTKTVDDLFSQAKNRKRRRRA